MLGSVLAAVLVVGIGTGGMFLWRRLSDGGSGLVLADGYDAGVQPAWSTPAPEGQKDPMLMGVDVESGTMLVTRGAKAVSLDLETGEQGWSADTPDSRDWDCQRRPWQGRWACQEGVTLDVETGNTGQLPLDEEEDVTFLPAQVIDGTLIYAAWFGEKTYLVGMREDGVSAWSKQIDGTLLGHTDTEIAVGPYRDPADLAKTENTPNKLIDVHTGAEETVERRWSAYYPLKEGHVESDPAEERYVTYDSAGNQVSSVKYDDTCVGVSWEVLRTITPDEFGTLGGFECTGRYKDKNVRMIARTEQGVLISDETTEKVEMLGAPGQDNAGQVLWSRDAKIAGVVDGQLLALDKEDRVQLLEPE